RPACVVERGLREHRMARCGGALFVVRRQLIEVQTNDRASEEHARHAQHVEVAGHEPKEFDVLHRPNISASSSAASCFSRTRPTRIASASERSLYAWGSASARPTAPL